jgi:hypothetical protein
LPQFLARSRNGLLETSRSAIALATFPLDTKAYSYPLILSLFSAVGLATLETLLLLTAGLKTRKQTLATLGAKALTVFATCIAGTGTTGSATTIVTALLIEATGITGLVTYSIFAKLLLFTGPTRALAAVIAALFRGSVRIAALGRATGHTFPLLTLGARRTLTAVSTTAVTTTALTHALGQTLTAPQEGANESRRADATTTTTAIGPTVLERSVQLNTRRLAKTFSCQLLTLSPLDANTTGTATAIAAAILAYALRGATGARVVLIGAVPIDGLKKATASTATADLSDTSYERDELCFGCGRTQFLAGRLAAFIIVTFHQALKEFLTSTDAHAGVHLTGRLVLTNAALPAATVVSAFLIRTIGHALSAALAIATKVVGRTYSAQAAAAIGPTYLIYTRRHTGRYTHTIGTLATARAGAANPSAAVVATLFATAKGRAAVCTLAAVALTTAGA